MNKSDNAYKTIGEVVKILDLKNRSGNRTATHTIRFWEKEFKQIKPKILAGSESMAGVFIMDVLPEDSANVLRKFMS